MPLRSTLNYREKPPPVQGEKRPENGLFQMPIFELNPEPIPVRSEPLPTKQKHKKRRHYRIDCAKISSIIDELHRLDLTPILSALKPPYTTGRRGYNLKSMLIAHISRYILDVECVVDWVEELETNPTLAAICGFTSRVPSESSFSRFNTLLSKIPEYMEALMHRLVDAIRGKIADLHAKYPDRYPEFGKEVAIDATAIQAFSNTGYKNSKVKNGTVSDKDAKWGKRHKVDSPDGDMVWFYGYKAHYLADANYDIPIHQIVTSGNKSDIRQLKPLYEKAAQTFQWFRPNVLLGDKGYDSEAMHRFLKGQGTQGIIPLKKTTAHDGLYDGLFNEDGAPTCLGMEPMEYVRTDPESKEQLWRCREKGCHLKDKGTKAITHCNDEVWFDPDDNPRVMGDIPRNSREWKKLYRKRWSVERVFNSMKSSRLLEGHRYRGIAKVRSHVITSTLAFLATTLAHLQQDNPNHMAWMRVRRA